MNIYVFFIVIFITLLIIFPFKAKSKITYNVLKNIGQIKFYLFKWNFLTFKVKLKPNYIYLTTKKGKVILVPIEFGDQTNIEYVDLTYILLDKTVINTLKISMNIGVEDNPFYTALLYGAFKTVNSIILSILKTKKLSIIVSNKINPVYTKDIGIINVSSSLTVTIFDYIWGILLYIIKLKKVGRRYETRRK